MLVGLENSIVEGFTYFEGISNVGALQQLKIKQFNTMEERLSAFSVARQHAVIPY